jgi:hypothetical protein
MDTNKTLEEGRDSSGYAKLWSTEALFDNCRLQDALVLNIGSTPTTSTKTAGRFIDHLAIGGVPITAAGILPINSTKTSDHSAVYIDIDAVEIFKSKTLPIVAPSPRRLSIKN